MSAVVASLSATMVRSCYRPSTPLVVEVDTTERDVVADLVCLRPTGQLSEAKTDPRHVGKSRLDGPIFTILAARTTPFSLEALR